MARASRFSPSHVSSGTVPISRKYMRTWSSKLSPSARVVVGAGGSISSATSSSANAAGCGPVSHAALSAATSVSVGAVLASDGPLGAVGWVSVVTRSPPFPTLAGAVDRSRQCVVPVRSTGQSTCEPLLRRPARGSQYVVVLTDVDVSRDVYAPAPLQAARPEAAARRAASAALVRQRARAQDRGRRRARGTLPGSQAA